MRAQGLLDASTNTVATVNETIRDRLLRHQVGLHRLATGTVRELITLLNKAEDQIQRQIERRIGWIAERGFDSSPFTTKRLEANLEEIRKLNREAYKSLGRKLRADLVDAGVNEADFSERLLGGVLADAGAETVAAGISGGVTKFNRQFVGALIDSRPFQGGLLKDWVATLAENTFRRVRSEVRQGLLQGETIPQITRRLRGTRAGRFQDGVLEIGRRQAENVVRTAFQHVAATARQEVYKENSDVVKAMRWSSTFDRRTCQLCAPRDGALYTLDGDSIQGAPPFSGGPGLIHMSCRCTAIPVVKSARELGLKRLPGLDGKPAPRISYEDWLRSQVKNHPKAIQGMMGGRLGPTRAKLIEDGNLSIAEMFGNRGEFLTLGQLRHLDRI